LLQDESQVPPGVNYIPEIVINGRNLKAVEEAMKVGIEVLLEYESVLGVSAGNYGGKLGQYNIQLKRLFE